MLAKEESRGLSRCRANACEGGEQGLVERREKDFKGGKYWLVEGKSKCV